ncbi:MAG: TRAP transporter substrate-binding protein [Acidimicrobiaceae bacterium]|nr:TRAP transporter substrate-binding protein [Acidimicrobiaceae bacterium]MDE0656607.1 TRAP transporter substrate-binding protein [Acidimicrobiaceae bacterium]MYF43681.1 TRAP transporter substrate-binding protein [Acidimicrobiaceae bacterium]
MTRRTQRWMRLTAVLLVLGLLAAACGDDDEVAEPAEAPATTAAPAPEPEEEMAEPEEEMAEEEMAEPEEEMAEEEMAEPEEEMAEEEMAEPEPVDFGDSVTVNLGHPFPARHPIQARALEPWSALVNEVTGGTVTVEFFAGGALGPAPQTYENAVSGAADIGWALQGYTPGRFPVTDVIEMPFTFSSASQATDVLWTLYEEFEEFQNEYSDVKLLGMWVHDVGDMWIAKGRVDTISDIDGLTLRAPSPVQNAVISALGGNPVGMPAPELYDSLERGVIDGLFIANSGLSSFNLYEVLESGVHCNCYVAAQFLAMNLDTWNSLSDAQRAAIDEVSGRVMSMNAAAVYDAAYESAAQRVVEAGIEKVQLDEAEFAQWRAATQGVIDSWIADNSGNFRSQEMYDRMLELAAG